MTTTNRPLKSTPHPDYNLAFPRDDNTVEIWQPISELLNEQPVDGNPDRRQTHEVAKSLADRWEGTKLRDLKLPPDAPAWLTKLIRRRDRKKVEENLGSPPTWFRRLRSLYRQDVQNAEREGGMVAKNKYASETECDNASKRKAAQDRRTKKSLGRIPKDKTKPRGLNEYFLARCIAEVISQPSPRGNGLNLTWRFISIAPHPKSQFFLASGNRYSSGTTFASLPTEQQVTVLNTAIDKVMDAIRKTQSSPPNIAFVVHEPHESGHAHTHLLLIARKQDIQAIASALRKSFLGRRECKVSQRLPVIEYVDYLFKTVFHPDVQGPGEFSQGTRTNREKAQVWRNGAGIRSTRVLGVPRAFMQSWRGHLQLQKLAKEACRTGSVAQAISKKPKDLQSLKKYVSAKLIARKFRPND